MGVKLYHPDLEPLEGDEGYQKHRVIEVADEAQAQGHLAKQPKGGGWKRVPVKEEK